jgi:hypothetical protein
MRKVRVEEGSAPPKEWLEEAEALKAKLRAAPDADARKKVIDENDGLWRDARIRDWLLSLFHNKCWYTEAYESVSAVHVDHYRPKGRALDLDGNECEGYWWLAFSWDNYRICGQLINVKKKDVFPICSGQRAISDDPDSLKLEATMLIDPTTDDARLVSYEMDEDSCVAVPAADVDNAEELRAKVTIDVLGLNRLDRLNQKRADVWRGVREVVSDYQSATGDPQQLKAVRQIMAISSLRKAVRYEREFSSVAEACIRKTAPEAVRAKVYG